MTPEQIQKIAHRMINRWACSEIHHGVRAKPLNEALAQFTRDKAQAHVLKYYDHAFGWVVEIYDHGIKIHESTGRAASAEELLHVFMEEAKSAIQRFGADKHGTFAPVKAT